MDLPSQAIRLTEFFILATLISGYNGCMIGQENWKSKFDNEIQNAYAARQAGNEGKARVCARRAAGLVAEQYLYKRRILVNGPSAYDHLRRLQSVPDLPHQAAEISARLLLRVTTEFKLAVQADLIDDALELRRILLEETEVNGS